MFTLPNIREKKHIFSLTSWDILHCKTWLFLSSQVLRYLLRLQHPPQNNKGKRNSVCDAKSFKKLNVENFTVKCLSRSVRVTLVDPQSACFSVIWVNRSFKRVRDWGSDVGDLVWNPVTDGPTVTVKLDVNMMTDISHPLTFPVITATMCVGAECFSFWCFLSRENEIVPCSNHCHWGLESLSHPDLYPGDSWQTLYTLRGFLLYFLERAITLVVVLVAD